jgi:hypothetical protein
MAGERSGKMRTSIVVGAALCCIILSAFLPVSIPAEPQERSIAQSESVRVPTNALTQAERNAISKFVEKRNEFPGLSNDEVRETVEILFRYSCSPANVIDLLGKPSNIIADGIVDRCDWLANDVGDSRRFEISFTTNGVNGVVKEVHGAGVGFRRCKVPYDATGKRTVIVVPDGK